MIIIIILRVSCIEYGGVKSDTVLYYSTLTTKSEKCLLFLLSLSSFLNYGTGLYSSLISLSYARILPFEFILVCSSLYMVNLAIYTYILDLWNCSIVFPFLPKVLLCLSLLVMAFKLLYWKARENNNNKKNV